jgi:hypothetical protein
MTQPYIALRQDPYGLAFSVTDLVLVRDWAEQRQLHLLVVLDRVMDGLEFEEMLILTPRRRRHGTLAIWRTRCGIFAQTSRTAPVRFSDLRQALDSHAPPADGARGRQVRDTMSRLLGFLSPARAPQAGAAGRLVASSLRSSQ